LKDNHLILSISAGNIDRIKKKEEEKEKEKRR